MDLNNLKKIETDFLIIGSGIAGLFTAYHLSKLGQVTVLTKESMGDSNTRYAQGGIAAVVDDEDSVNLHLEDTLKAGAGLCKKEAVEVLVEEGPDRVNELIEMGTQFDYKNGRLDLTQEGAHSQRRVLHARGDATGEEIRESLVEEVRPNKNISLSKKTFMIDLVLDRKDPNRVNGVLVWHKQKKEYVIYQASAVVMASGGCGQVFANTSNPEVTTGDGIAAAYRAGVKVMDMEFIQFHPTTYYNPKKPPFLISETVRGEGGILRNSAGERFMPDYHSQAELAPRDVVARAILKEINQGSKPYVYLDITQEDSKYIKERFPTIFNRLQEENIDMTEEWIPVIPAAHYMMGGIKSDLNGCSSKENLFVCGEVACTGVHGANRLASNSLLEGLVFGYRIYKYISNNRDNQVSKEEEFIIPSITNYGDSFININQRNNSFREKMMKSAGIIREKNKLENMVTEIEAELKMLNKIKAANQQLWEYQNMLIVGKLIVLSALKREESRGAHYRNDCPQAIEKWKKKHIIFNENNPEGTVNVLE